MEPDQWGESLLDDKLQLAILYFKSKEYTKALKSYNDIIRYLSTIPINTIKTIRKDTYGLQPNPIIGPTVHPKLGSVVDQRAATYEKLGYPEKALKDAQQLIKLEPISCKGYLRTGKLLAAMDKELEAYKNFQLGIYTIDKAKKEHGIDVPKKLYDSMKEKYSELNRQLKQGRAKQEDKPVPNSQGTSTSSSRTSSFSSIKSKSSTPSSSQKSKQASLSFVSARSMVSTSSSYTSNINDVMPSKRSNSSFLVEPKKLKRSMDPMLHFPPEIIHLIFQNVPFKKLLSYHTVSKKWYSQLTSLPKLYLGEVSLRNSITLDEFARGIALMKRVLRNTYLKRLENFKIRSTLNSWHLLKILGTIITEPNFSLRSFEIFDPNFNLQVFISQLIKHSWRLNNLNGIENFQIGINSSLRYQDIVFELFKRLKSLTIIVLYPEQSGKYNDLVNTNDPRLKKLIQNQEQVYKEPYSTLESLTIVNNPKLLKDYAKTTPKWETYNPYPFYLTRNFPNLKELTLASFEFGTSLPDLGEFFLRTPNLVKLVCENNVNFSFLQFLQMLKNYNPAFKLEKLSFREVTKAGANSLNEFVHNDLEQLQQLGYLDIEGTSLSCKGFMKLLDIVNPNNTLTTLMMGSSPYLKFTTDAFHSHGTRSPIISLYDILVKAPNLTSLYLNDLELDHQSLKSFSKDIKRFGVSECKLKLLDLSFSRVNGLGIIDLFEAYSWNLKQMESKESISSTSQSAFGRSKRKVKKEVGPAETKAPLFKLDELILDGIEINEGTLNMLMKNGFVRVIRNDVNKQRWKQFGMNSLIVP